MCDCPFALEALTCVRAPFRAALRTCSMCVCEGFIVPALPFAVAFAAGGLNTCACPVHTLIAAQSKQAVAPCPRVWGSRNGRFAIVIRACPLTCLKLCVCKNNSSRSTPAVHARRMHTRNGLYRHGARRCQPHGGVHAGNTLEKCWLAASWEVAAQIVMHRRHHPGRPSSMCKLTA